MKRFVLLHAFLVIIIASYIGCNLVNQTNSGPNSGSNSDRVKVFILAGGSNMVGQGKIEPDMADIDKNDGQGTLWSLVDDEMQTYEYGHLADEMGQWSELKNVWLVDFDYSEPLSANIENTFGPELQFGYEIADHYPSGKVLIIKTAWNGKSLYQDFRSPSSGETTGPYYREMISRIYEVLGCIECFYPHYQGEGYEIAGFGWHQGWDDRISPGASEQYQENCVNLINDLREEFNLPSMPFVLATTGMGGWSDTSDEATALIYAQLAVPDDDRLNNKSNVAAIDTRDFWRDAAISPSDIDYHWNGNAESYFRIGKEMGQTMTSLLPQEKRGSAFEAEEFSRKRDCTFKSANPGFTGKGYMDFGGEGSWIKWNYIKASKAGEYKLKFRYANGGARRPCSIIANGRNVGTVAFKNTGSNKNWEYNNIKVKLKKGINKIKVKATTSNGGPNLDHMQIVGLSPDDPDDPDDPVDPDPIDSCGTLDPEAIANSMGQSYSTSTENKVYASVSALTKHITGANTLPNSEVAQHKSIIESNINYLGYTKKMIVSSMDLVKAYEAKFGPFFMNDFSKNLRRDELKNDIHGAILSVMQGVVDNVYTDVNVKKCSAVLNGKMFKSSEHFPGKVTSIPDPDKIHTAKIKASYRKTFGHLVMHYEKPAIKPTGTYLAPGSIATVTVPDSLVGKGYNIRIGAQGYDISNKPWIRRLDRSSIVYSIKNTVTKVASPLGGGIYIEVPYRKSAGIVDVQIKNAVRSPYFSMKSFHQTSLDDWRNTEREHGAPWADFQTDKFMAQVPTSWIYNYDDPKKALAKWDTAMDVVSDLMGFPHNRGKETLYVQVDVIIRAKAYSPGYPQVNMTYDPSKDYNGNENK